jgi:replication factor C subunit 3/5
VEKYRPSVFDGIILTNHNKVILESVVSNQFNVNMLFYGPPGTGKTTTIINMIKKYHANKRTNNGLVMHLNASDDRGIELIRNQLYSFVNSNNLFGEGKKIIVLDEADYMTKLAQQALKILVERYNDSIRFVLICNYITKIESSLQNILMHIRFNHLPIKQIIDHLFDICKSENITIPKKALRAVQEKFRYDIRSMINFLQFNYVELSKADTDCAMSEGIDTSAVSRETYRLNTESVISVAFIEDIIATVEQSGDAECVGIIEKKISSVYDMRKFWTDLFCHMLKTDARFYPYAWKIKYFLQNENIDDTQINIYCNNLLRKIII